MRGFLIVATLALVACGDDRPTDLGEVCSSTGEAACQRAIQCAGGSYAECFNLHMGGCCVAKAKCGGAVRETVTWDDVDACTAALRASSCADLGNGILPPACLTW
jgi:hypothetical protein